jgi:integrase
VNRSLATLRRALRKAQERRVIDRIPKIKLNLKGERNREFVLPRDREAEYVNECPELLRDLAVFILYTGLRVGEATRLEWRDVHPDPVGEAKYGYVQIREGKTDNAKRTVPLLPRLATMIRRRAKTAVDQFVFPQCTRTYLCRLHALVREKMGLPADAVIHSLRHTLLTRLAEVGTDIGTLKEIAGHARSSVTERYVHPSSESKERAFDKLEAAYPEIAAGVQELHMKASRREKKSRK